MKTSAYIATVLVTACAPASAQKIGIGFGLAAPNDKIAQVSSDLVDRGVNSAQEQAESGYYVELRGRFGGATALTGGIGYNRFLEATSDYQDNAGRTIRLQTAQTVIPLSAGIEHRFGGSISPYLSLEVTYNRYYRTFESIQGDVSIPIQYEESDEGRFGASLGGGIDLNLKVVDISVGARVHLMNLLNKDAGESAVHFAQLGTVVYLGI